MNLNLFNSWKDLTKWSGHVLQWQTSKKGNVFITYIRDKESGKPVVSGISRTSKEESLQRATDTLKQVGIEGVKNAIENDTLATPPKQQDKDVDWRDGIGHSYRAQRDIVDKGRSVV